METSIPVPPVVGPSRSYIAPWWHTALLLVFLLGFSAMGSAGHPGLDHSLRMKLYLSTIVMEWLMVLFILWGLKKNRQTTIAELVGGRWTSVESFLIDIVVAFGFWIVAAMVLAAIGLALGLANTAHLKDVEHRIGSLVPATRGEMVTWVLLSATAGICEEIIYRGYLQRQMSALLKSVWAGILLQGLIFGASHAYEGWQTMVQIAAFGILFGILANWRKSLRPGMMAHFMHDSAQGLLVPWALKHAAQALPK